MVFTTSKEPLDFDHDVYCNVAPEMQDCELIAISIREWSDGPAEPSCDELDNWEVEYESFLVIGKTRAETKGSQRLDSSAISDHTFLVCETTWEKPIAHRKFDFGEWSTKPATNANFVEIANRYGLLIVTICEKWGFNPIVKWIKDHN
jgi:hypothetical protein